MCCAARLCPSQTDTGRAEAQSLDALQVSRRVYVVNSTRKASTARAEATRCLHPESRSVVGPGERRLFPNTGLLSLEALATKSTTASSVKSIVIVVTSVQAVSRSRRREREQTMACVYLRRIDRECCRFLSISRASTSPGQGRGS